MRAFEDSVTGKTFVEMTTEEALDLLAPQYEKDEFSLEDAHNQAIERVEIQAMEESIHADKDLDNDFDPKL